MSVQDIYQEDFPMSRRLQAAMDGLCDTLGIERVEGADSIEFSTDDLQLAVHELQDRDDLLHCEVQLRPSSVNRTLQERDFILLHNINETSRLEHEWVVSVGVDNIIRIHCCMLTSATDASVLQLKMAEGIERGEALLEILAGAAEPQNETAGPIYNPNVPAGFTRA
jgi:hypothetical protein